MLAYVLALIVGLGSLALYMAAFFFPEVHRKQDFILSGIGLFYALVLWVCAGRITGGVLLGQMAGVGLVGWLGWETLNLRRGITPGDQQTALPTPEALQSALTNLTKPEVLSGLPGQIGSGLNQFVERVRAAIAAGSKAKQAAAAAVDAYVPLKREDFARAVQEGVQSVSAAVDTAMDTAVDTTREQAAAVVQDVEEAVSATVESATAIKSSAASSFVEEVGRVVEVPKAAPPAPPGSGAPSTASDLIGKVTGMLGAIAAAIPALLQGLTKKKESQPIYVRKQFRRDAAGVDSDTVTAESSGPGVAGAIADVESTLESAVETVLEAADVSAAVGVESPVMDLDDGNSVIAPDPIAPDNEETENTEAATINAFADAHEAATVPDEVGVAALKADADDADEFDPDWQDAEGVEPDVSDLPIDPPFIEE